MIFIQILILYSVAFVGPIKHIIIAAVTTQQYRVRLCVFRADKARYALSNFGSMPKLVL